MTAIPHECPRRRELQPKSLKETSPSKTKRPFPLEERDEEIPLAAPFREEMAKFWTAFLQEMRKREESSLAIASLASSSQECGIQKDPEKEETESPFLFQPSAPLSSKNPFSEALSSERALPALSALSQIEQLFDKMVGTMSVMALSGVTETSICLDALSFAGSIFHGSEITIKEFNTAPLAFNIQFAGSAESIALFQMHLPNLMAAFHKGSYNFTINRVETHFLSSNLPLVKRKESVFEDNQEQEGNDSA